MAADVVGSAIDLPVQPLLAIANVSKSFGGVRAVENVTVSIRRGEIMSVIWFRMVRARHRCST